MKELIKKAKEIGFEAEFVRLHTVNTSIDNLVCDEWFFLWMCELQKWLRDKHNIFAEVNHKQPDVKNRFFSFVRNHFFRKYPDAKKGYWYSNAKVLDSTETYEQALEQALIEALKLINQI